MPPQRRVFLGSSPCLALAPTPPPFSPIDVFPEIGWLQLGLLAVLIVLAWEVLKSLIPQAVAAALGGARRWASSRADKAAQERAVREFTQETLGTNWLSCLPSISRLVGDAPLEEIYQPLAFSFSSRDRQLSSAPLAQVLSSARSFAIVGTPGCGKSTLLSMVALTYARGTVEDELRLKESRLPIFLALARLPAELGALPEVAAAALGRAGCEVQAAFLRDQLKNGRCILLLDGLDEAVAPARQSQLARWIHDSISAFPGNRFLVTCRTTEWSTMRVPGLSEARILPLEADQRAHLIDRWSRLLVARGLEPAHVIEARSAGLKSTLTGPQDAHLAMIAANPFLLTIMTVLHLGGIEIPDRRSRLYDALVRAMLGEWDLVKGVGAAPYTPDAIAARMGFFQRAALYLAQKPGLRDRIDLADRELAGLLDAAAEELVGKGERAAPLLAEARRTGLLVEEEPRIFAFANRGILEFLAARELVRLRDVPAAVRHAGESSWHEILLQLSEQTADLESFLRLLAESSAPRRGPFLQLLAHSILEARSRGLPVPRAQEMLREHLLESARRDDVGRDLARVSWRALGEPWQQLVAKAAGGDGDVMPVSSALRLLAYADDACSIAALCKALADAPPEVGKMAAEALQEVPSPEATALLWKLAVREESSRAAIESLSARGEAVLPSARSALANGTPPEGSPAERKSLAAIRVLAGTQSPAALGALLELAGRCSPSLHLAIVAALHEKQLASGGLDEARRIVDRVLGEPTFYTRYGKRALDILLSALVLLLSLPVLALAAVCVRLESPGPVLFRQRRLGRGGREFEMLRLRTLRADAEASAQAWAVVLDPRVTRVGRLLRRTRLDELPSFFNVLHGDMSFVGPRPQRPQFSEHLLAQIPYYDKRMSLAPGLTGLAQLQLPYASTFEESVTHLAWDLYYVARCSFGLDLTILARTVILVLIGRGAFR